MTGWRLFLKDPGVNTASDFCITMSTMARRYARGETPASFALSMSVYMIAATSVPRREREP